MVTNAHVVSGGSTIWIKSKQGTFTGRIVKRDKLNDLALVKIISDAILSSNTELPDFTPVAVNSSSGISLGDSVFTIGYPNIEVQGFQPKFTKGEINSLSGMQDDPRYFQVSAQIQPGNSGGPLIDKTGNVIGIVSCKLADIELLQITGQLPQNVNYALKSSALLEFLNAVPELDSSLMPPLHTGNPDFQSIVAEATDATVLLIVQ